MIRYIIYNKIYDIEVNTEKSVEFFHHPAASSSKSLDFIPQDCYCACNMILLLFLF